MAGARGLVGTVDKVLSRATLAARGTSDAELGRLVRRGELERIRRGCYARAPVGDQSLEERHLLAVAAAVPLLEPPVVLSHGSAAVVRRLPVWPQAVEHVHITHPRRGGGRRRTTVHRHASALDHHETALVDGWQVTSLARTVVDLARTLPFEQAVAAADRAQAVGLEPTELAETVERARRWPGAIAARRVEAFADRRSESAGESVSRVRILELGLPAPEPQLRIVDGEHVVARVDFGWAELRTVAEFDGKVKYGRLLRPGQEAGDVVFREKQREDMLRDLGWEVVRWIWADLAHPEVIEGRLRRAFRRGTR